MIVIVMIVGAVRAAARIAVSHIFLFFYFGLEYTAEIPCVAVC